MSVAPSRALALLAALVTAVTAGCADEDLVGGGRRTGPRGNGAELAYPGATGQPSSGAFVVNGASTRLPFEVVNGDMVHEGDIILGRFEGGDARAPEGETSSTAQAVAARREGGLWPSAIVPYTVDPALPDPERVTAAIAHWEANTALRFRRRTTEADYATFRGGEGCSSHVGRIGGQQFVTLNERCTGGSTIHEIGHLIGLWHTQSRVDREMHVRINWANIESGKEHNFRTYREDGQDGRDIGAYDIRSIMHYGSYYFSSNGMPTITTRDGGTFEPQRDGLSAGDIAGVTEMYGTAPVRTGGSTGGTGGADAGTGMTPTTDPCASSTSCGTCASRAGCGWCNGRCVSGGAVGPTDGASCGSAGWVWSPSVCAGGTTPVTPTDACASATSCDACTARASCGWCAGRCVAGSASGGGGCTATAGTWAWVATQCGGGGSTSGGTTPPPPPDACASATSCDACTARSSCGWCAGRCVTGTSVGGATCTTSAGNWAWVASQCGGSTMPPPPADACASATSCSACTGRASCGWCNGRCVTGTSVGGAECSTADGDWAWTSNQCF